MVFSALAMSLVYFNVFMMDLKYMSVLQTLELAVVIYHHIHNNSTSNMHLFHVHVYFVLLAPPCRDNEIRLLYDQVQICYNEVWGYVCDSNLNWNNNDASVVCRELGFLSQGAHVLCTALCVL